MAIADHSWVRLLPAPVRPYLAGQRQRQQIIGNIGWLLADNVLRTGLGIPIAIWLTRYLGPEQSGAYSYALYFVALFGALAPLGLNTITVREIVRNPERRDEILGTTMVLKVIGALATLALILLAITVLQLSDGQARWLIGIAALSLVFQSFETIDFAFQARTQSRYTVWARNGAFALTGIAKIAFLWLGGPLVAFVWLMVAESALCALGFLGMYRYSGQRIGDWRYSWRCARELLNDSWPLVLSSVAVTIYMYIDQLMLGEMLGNHAVGIYSAVTRLSEVWYFVPMVILSSVLPAMVAAKKVSEAVYLARLQTLFAGMAAFSYAVALPTTFIATPLVLLLFGDRYAAAGPVLVVHIWSLLFVALGVARQAYLTTENLTRFSFVSTAAGAMVNVMMNLVLIPRFGPQGAAFATLVSYAVAGLISCAFYRPTQHIGQMMLRALVLRR